MSKEKIGLNDTDIGSKYLEQVKSYKYPESIVNGDNSIEEDIKEKVVQGSQAYYANQKMQISTKESRIKVVLDYNKTRDNTFQRKMGNERIYETKIINKCKKDVKKNIRTYKGKR